MRLGLRMGLNSRQGGGGDLPSLDLAFALDKTLTARRGPTPVFTRVQATSTGSTYVGADRLIKYAAANEPRFDYDPATGASKGLLIEEPRENFAPHSQSFANLYWASFATASATDNITTSPSGVASSASRITANSGTDPSRYRLGLFSITAGSSPRTASVFLKAGTHGFGVVSLAFNKVGVGEVRSTQVRVDFSNGSAVQTGTLTGFSFAVTPYLDGWWRISISATSNASTAVEDQAVMAFGLSFNSTGTSGAFTGTETIFGWGAQLEAGVFPLSYIPTTSGTAIRGADVCSIIGDDFSSFYNRLACTVDASFIPATIALPTSVCGTNDPRDLEVQMIGGGNIVGLNTNSAGTNTQLSRSPVAVGVRQNFAFASESNNQAVCLNGGTVLASPTWVKNTGVSTIFYIGRAGFGGQYSGHIDRITVYRKRLSNAKLQALTAL